MKFNELPLGQSCVKMSDLREGVETVSRFQKIDTDAKHSENSLLCEAVHQGGVLVNCINVHTGALSYIDPNNEIVHIL